MVRDNLGKLRLRPDRGLLLECVFPERQRHKMSRIHKIFAGFLFTGSRHQLNDLTTAVPRFQPVLIITILPGCILVNNSDENCQSSPKRRQPALRCRAYLCSTGILTSCPFPYLPLRGRLGPTNP